MGTLLSTISGYLSRQLLLANFLPAAIFFILLWLLLVPHLPVDLTLIVQFLELDKEWRVAVVLFLAILATGLLHLFNYLLIRWYEGYPWKDTWLGGVLTRRHIKKYRAAQNRISGMRTFLRYAQPTEEKFRDPVEVAKFERFLQYWTTLRGFAPEFEDRRYVQIWGTPVDDLRNRTYDQWQEIWSEVLSKFSKCRRYLAADYPEKESLILPTRVGNVIRSFEYRPDREYGIDAVKLYTRLVAKVDKDYAAQLDNAKTNFDFMINGSFLSGTLCILILVAGLYNPSSINSPPLFVVWLAKLAVFAALSSLMYRLSLSEAMSWGEFVNGAFDLYRGDLLKQLGYTREALSRKEESTLWDGISRKMIFGDIYDVPVPDYAVAPPAPDLPSFARGQPGDIALELTRGVKTGGPYEPVTIVLFVRNNNAAGNVREVTITDTLPAGYGYVWDSARAESGEVEVFGTNPYRFKLGALDAQDDMVVTYRAARGKG